LIHFLFLKISLSVRPYLVADVEDVFDVGTHSVMLGGQKGRVQHDADGDDEIYPGAGDDSLEQRTDAPHGGQTEFQSDH
jgi:hypothetical protein